MITNVRPNPERDALAGYTFASALDLASEVAVALKGFSSAFPDVSVTSNTDNMYLSDFGEVFLGKYVDPNRVAYAGLGEVATVTAVTSEAIDFNNEHQYFDAMNAARNKLLDAADEEKTRLANHLLQMGRSKIRTQHMVDNRYIFCINGMRGGNYLVNANGVARPNVASLSYTFIDRLCDLEQLGSDDDYSPTITAIRDVVALSVIRLKFVPINAGIQPNKVI
jgi:hypothetical protein